MNGNYAFKIRLALEHMFDFKRAQNAGAAGLINMWPDPETGNGFHAKYQDGFNRHVYNATLESLGVTNGIPDVALLNSKHEDLFDYLKRHIDNSQNKRISQHAYSVRKLPEEEIARVFLEVVKVEATESTIEIVREMPYGFISLPGPEPDDVDEILAVEDRRVPSAPGHLTVVADQEEEEEEVIDTLFPEEHVELVHLFERGSEVAYCGSRVTHVCDGLSDLGYQLSYTMALTCRCGAPICPTCRLKQPVLGG